MDVSGIARYPGYACWVEHREPMCVRVDRWAERQHRESEDDVMAGRTAVHGDSSRLESRTGERRSAFHSRESRVNGLRGTFDRTPSPARAARLKPKRNAGAD